MTSRTHTGAAAALAMFFASQAPELQRFQALNNTFHIELPKGWRQLSPNEARRLADVPGAPKQLTFVAPGQFYAVGPVDAWLAGDFSGPWLNVVEHDAEWIVEDDYVDRLRELWRTQGEAVDVQHELADVRREPVGTDGREAVTARRTSTPKPPAVVLASLDVHAPAGGRQLNLSFTCPAAAFTQNEPEFRRWLATLTFARKARGAPTLSGRLWTPLIVGGLVTVVMLLLYKHTRRGR